MNEKTPYLVMELKKRHPRMSFLCEGIECPFCHQPVGEPCKTKTGHDANMPHGARFDTFRAMV